MRSAMWLLACVAAATGLAVSRGVVRMTRQDERSSQLWRELTPAGPFNRPIRRTLVKEMVPDAIWALEQVQGFLYVHVPVRALVVEWSRGMVCYGAVAPTEEAMRLLEELEAERNKSLTSIILPSTATEHKLFAIALAKRRPEAELWIAPSQFAFPVDVPGDVLGLTGARLLNDAACPDWGLELPWTRVGPFLSRDQVSNFEEILCVHLASKTLLCCDLLVSVPAAPPDIVVYNDPRALLFHGRADANTTTDLVDGWKKICLFALYFQSSPLEVTSPPDGTLRGAIDFFRTAFPPSTAAPKLGWANFFAWSWPDKAKTDAAFEALRADGRLLVPPVLAVAILNRQAEELHRVLLDELDPDFTTVLPCHFDAPLAADVDDVYDAFNAAVFTPLGLPPLRRPGLFHAFRRQPTTDTPPPPASGPSALLAAARRRPPREPLPEDDLRFLYEFEQTLVDNDVIAPRPC